MSETRVEPADRIAALYATHAGRAIRFAYLMTGSREDAEDLVQEAFVRAASRLTGLRRDDAFGAYMRQTMVNLLRSRRRRARIARSFRHDTTWHVEDPSQASDERRWILGVLATLPARQRAAIVLRYYEDLTEAQAAEALHCSRAALKSLVARASETLRARLGGITDE